MTISPVTFPRARRPRRMHVRSERATARGLRRTQYVACIICGTAVRPDDAIGLVAGSITHAECALLKWIGPSQPDDTPDLHNAHDEMGAQPQPRTDAQWFALIQALLGRHS